VRTHKFIQTFEITFKAFLNFLLVAIRFCMFHPFFYVGLINLTYAQFTVGGYKIWRHS
jgi:hypothetical protein